MKTPAVLKVSGAKIHGFRFAIGDLGQVHSVDGVDHLGQQSIHVRAVRPYSGDSDVESLPNILIPNLRDRHIKIILKPVFNGSDNLTLAL
jgi:hypothetical protein